ncbi:Hypothetical predicted protein [Pelobates cultripes]|uniref:Uncharacterized protein n=1 Tax=Pelobates cultripes TaxID=61616 RepID=A0AAD1TCN9_PELCU|nr:Hypothetical predicted protein [Pelobates cultripes]
MPFFLQPGEKQKCWPPKATHTASQRYSPHAAAAWWDTDWLTPHHRQAQTPEEIGKKFHKSQASVPQDTRDTGKLLQRTPKPRELVQAEIGVYDYQEKDGVSEDTQGQPTGGATNPSQHRTCNKTGH